MNAMSVHPKHGTLATGGADGAVAFWDWMVRQCPGVG